MISGCAIGALMQMWPSKCFMASSEFVEKVLIQCVTGLSCTCRHEDVATDVLMHYLTVCIHAAESYVNVAIKFNGHLIKRNIPKTSQKAITTRLNVLRHKSKHTTVKV